MKKLCSRCDHMNVCQVRRIIWDVILLAPHIKLTTPLMQGVFGLVADSCEQFKEMMQCEDEEDDNES